MRILAIRGENIASLQKFAIDFTGEPLRSAGVFAITGPTGAGKSTIFDTLCLALFVKAPRLEGTADGGLEAGAFGVLQNSDAKNLIRRGCSTCFAEAEYVGVDGCAYRARWGYRAGKRRGAAPQQEFSLVEVASGQVLVQGDRIQEYLRRVQDTLGWTYEQFTRAVLLAQGRFAEFLRAKEPERAELLEKLTGTAIYGEISKQVYERHKAESFKLGELQARMAGLQPLGEEQKAQLETERSHLTTEMASAALRESALRQTEAMLRQAIATASQLESLQAELADCKAHGMQCAESSARAQAEFEAEKRRFEDAEPLIAQSLVLDERLRQAQLNVTNCQAQEAEALRREESLQKELAALDAHDAQVRAGWERDQAWLAAHPREKGWSAEWATMAGHFEACASQSAQRQRLAETYRKAQNQADGLHAQYHKIAQDLQGFADLANAADAEATERDYEQAVLTRDRTLASINSEIIRRKSVILSARRDDLQAEVQQASRAAGECRAAEQVARTALDNVRQSLGDHVEGLRSALRPGEACPVCGAFEHPYADGGSTALKALLAQQESAWLDARKALENAERSAQQAALALASLEGEWTALGPVASAGDFPWQAATASLDEAAFAAWAREHSDACEQVVRVAKEQHVRMQEFRRLHEQQTALAARLADAQNHGAETQQNLSACEASLAVPVAWLNTQLGADWFGKWELDPHGYVDNCQQAASDASEALKRCEQASVLLEGNAVRRDEMRKHWQQATDAFHKLHAETQNAQASWQALQMERMQILGGRAGEEVRQEFRERLNQLQKTHTATAQALQQARESWSGLSQKQATLEAQAQDLRTQVAAALAPSEDTSAAQLLQSVLEELQALLRQREANGDRLAGIKEQLARDAAVLKDLAESAQKLDSQKEVTGNWAQLSQLIGSADGKAFRKIAQQYTLGILLVHANAQLSTITGRYRLEAIENTMQFCIVDSEAFGEKRPVHTLSGGETFMVSLALALGLARMASGNLQVESLFIDEGFGTLDPDTLRGVLAALANLQSQGRKVGLITHVEEMKHQIPVRIDVVPTGQGGSSVRIVNGGAS